MPADFWTSLPLGREVTLLHHDENGVAAFAKPAGLLSHPNTRGDEGRSLLRAGYRLDEEVYIWTPTGETEPRRLWLLNRLDSATSGVILAVADGALAAAIRALFQRKHIRKIYHALVFGRPAETRQVWRDRLAIEKRGGHIRTGGGGNIPAEAEMTVVAQHAGAPPLALIRLEPRTGRSHQLRVQCAKRHLPIVGDATYGDFGANREFARARGTKRLFLHSSETSFTYEVAGREQRFSAEAPLPKEFAPG